jgi:hypothetical protein
MHMTDHEEYRDLCTAFLTDSLTKDERSRLEKHVVGCSECRTALGEYQTVVREVLPALAARLAPDNLGDEVAAWSPDRTEQKIFARLAVESGSVLSPVSKPRNQIASGRSLSSSLPNLLPYAASVLLAIGVGFGAYHFGVERGEQASRPAVPVAALSPNPLQSQLQALAKERDELNSRLQDRDAAIANLEAKIRRQLEQNSELQARVNDANQQAQDQNVTSAADRAELSRDLERSQVSAADLQKQLDSLKQSRSDETIRVATLEDQIRQLSSDLIDRDNTIAQQQQFLSSDRDIRDLIGARDLYIAEVYDVDKNAETKRPFGRVFYTKGKSLVFYGYDLDQQPGIRNASTFQAWGLRGPDRKNALSLGILYVDNSAKKRWVLRFDDPKALEQINAVFVTVEPNGGSRVPSGKSLLFAYLQEEPNHP